jgi:AcrR family transcriptional regulator
VAAKARISKGTVYTYFQSKDDLYVSIVREGAGELVRRLRARLATRSGAASEFLREVVHEICAFAVRHPHVFKLASTGKLPEDDGPSPRPGEQVLELIETVIRRGVDQGELTDPHPELTAQFVCGVVVEVMKRATERVDAEALADQVMQIFLQGLLRRP